MSSATTETTSLRRLAHPTDASGLHRLFGLLYADLKRMAQSRLRRSRSATIGATSVVHDSFMRVREQPGLPLHDHDSFVRYIGRVMRNVITDHLRSKHALKRGGAEAVVPLTTSIEKHALDVQRGPRLTTALEKLARVSPEAHRLVELRYFTGLSLAEIAAQEGQSERTLARQWNKARELLLQLMADQG